MRKALVVLALLVAVVGVAASAHPFGMPGPKLEINETNFEEVKARMISNLEERINALRNLKAEIENANSADELKSVMEKHALGRAKDMAMRKIERAIEIAEKSGNSDALSELEALKDKVSNATSMDELKEIMEELRTILEDAGIRPFRQHGMGGESLDSMNGEAPCPAQPAV